MSRQIIKKMNKDIDQLFLCQNKEIKDLCHIQRKTVSIIKPTVLFVVVSLILCFHIYQIQPSVQNTYTTQSEEITQKENNKKNATAETESIITEDKQNKKTSKETKSNETKSVTKYATENNTFHYISIYVLGGLDILIIIYIFIKKSNKI